MNKVFVYGSLKEGFINHRVLGGAKKVCSARMGNSVLFSLGAFPALKNTDNTNDIVHGEIYEVPDFHALDRLEGHPDFYKRTEGVAYQQVGDEVVTHDVSYYQYQLDTSKKAPIASGNW